MNGVSVFVIYFKILKILNRFRSKVPQGPAAFQVKEVH